jgi:hypothetical protein
MGFNSGLKGLNIYVYTKMLATGTILQIILDYYTHDIKYVVGCTIIAIRISFWGTINSERQLPQCFLKIKVVRRKDMGPSGKTAGPTLQPIIQ